MIAGLYEYLGFGNPILESFYKNYEQACTHVWAHPGSAYQYFALPASDSVAAHHVRTGLGDVSVYIFAGREDVNAMPSIVERCYNILEAPHKELIWLNGGHGLNESNLGQFVDVMVNKVLAETYIADD